MKKKFHHSYNNKFWSASENLSKLNWKYWKLAPNKYCITQDEQDIYIITEIELIGFISSGIQLFNPPKPKQP